MEFRAKSAGAVLIRMSEREPEAVRIAAQNLERDLKKVLKGVQVIWEWEEAVNARGERPAARSREEAVDVYGERPAARSREEAVDARGECPAARSREEAVDARGELAVIRIGTVGISEQIADWADADRMRREAGELCQEAGEPGGEDGRTHQEAGEPRGEAGRTRREAGELRREAFQIRVRDGQLVLAGADRRGTVYAIYSFCEWMGVSPWYFWADVPVYPKEELALPEGYCVTDWPSVEYRGIFINDEEELEAWVKNYMKESTIGVKTYEKVFELLLRLKGNYIWPAMHVNSFNLKPENGALAERMGIVVGTSHCDMLMRSNNREWIPWITKKGYADAVYDYSVEGRNREILKEYWRESVEQNRDFEVCYTLGMRGIHDSGFETKNLEGRSAEEIRAAKTALLQKIIADQREILKSTLGHETMTTFIPYKEVLDLYDNGLEIPEDVTLVWANDNYGYIRRYPSEKEKGRRGGNGIYYHNSYWAPPSMSYVFLCSIPLAHTRHELQKAWDEGIRRLWVLNCGAMKPLELEITFFLRLAWEIGKDGALTENVEAFAADWADKTFSGNIGREVSALLNDFSQLTNVRKLENMDYDAFSQTAYGDEAAVRIHRYEELFERGNALYEGLPGAERDAFFQLVLMRIHAGYFTNLAYYYGDRSTLMYDRGNMQAAALYTKKSRQFEDARRRMVLYYNTVMSEGKWNGMVNPEGFPPPRAAMMPVCTPPLAVKGEPRMRVDLWNEDGALELYGSEEKWIEIGNLGTGALELEIRLPGWLEVVSADAGTAEEQAALKGWEPALSGKAPMPAAKEEDRIRLQTAVPAPHGGGDGVALDVGETGPALQARVSTELRLCLRAAKEAAPESEFAGGILIVSRSEGRESYVPARLLTEKKREEGARERDGLIVLEGDSAEGIFEADSGFSLIPRLGRCRGNLVEARIRVKGRQSFGAEQDFAAQRPLVYPFTAVSTGSFLLEIHRFPSLNSVGRIRIGVSLDEGPVQIAESVSNDEWRGSWKKNVLNNVDRLYVELGTVEKGPHRLNVYAVDPYFAFSRLVIYTKPRKENNLAGVNGAQGLPKLWDERRWCEGFYGEAALKPRTVEYRCRQGARDSLSETGCKVTEDRFAEPVRPGWYLERGERLFEEQKGGVSIDAASALAQSRFARMSGGLWRHCAGESFGRSGLCLYVRERERRWEKAADAPALHYRFACTGGTYTIWMLSKFNDAAESRYSLGIDGREMEGDELYQKGSLFRYESEQIYQWVPAARPALEAGEHVLDVYSMASGLRFDRFYLTKGEELPPSDPEWNGD